MLSHALQLLNTGMQQKNKILIYVTKLHAIKNEMMSIFLN